MKQPRILYLDVPFENESGGDKNRSRFLWNALRNRFKTDLLLLGHKATPDRPLWTRHKPLAILAPQSARFPNPSSTPQFAPQERETFRSLISRNQYDAVFSRFCTPWELCLQAAGESPDPRVIVDVDMLSSRLVALSWARNPSLRRRWFLFEKWKLRRLERTLFRKPWLFLFTNRTELEIARAHAAPTHPGGVFATLPNTMPPAGQPHTVARKPVILFFGSMDSAANIDGFEFLVDDVLPHLAPELKRHGVSIHVVGKNPPASFRERLTRASGDRVTVVGGVDSIDKALAESLFVLLPLRIASGTRTRILEAAAQARAVVTTPLGAEGLDLDDHVLLGNTGEELARLCTRLLDSESEAETLGHRLREQAVGLYAQENVAENLAREINTFIHSGREKTQ